MRGKGRSKCLFLLVFFSCLAALLFAKAQVAAAPPNQKQTYTILDNVNLVVLDVSVRDSRGSYVTGLKESNFAVYEDARPQKISQFASVDTPVTVGLVVDNSGSMETKRPEVILAGLAFAKESNPQDEFFVINFNDSVTRGLPGDTMFTDNLQVLRKALYFGEAKGQTALYDAVGYALNHLEHGHLDKRTLIVVSDGGDNCSSISFADLMKIIESSRATIYTIGLLDPEDRDLNPGVLRKMAMVSGGQFFEPSKLSDIIPVFDKISTDIRNRYTIAYVPDEVHDRHVIRTIKVEAEENGRGLMVRTRRKYSIVPASLGAALDAPPSGRTMEQRP